MSAVVPIDKGLKFSKLLSECWRQCVKYLCLNSYKVEPDMHLIHLNLRKRLNARMDIRVSLKVLLLLEGLFTFGTDEHPKHMKPLVMLLQGGSVTEQVPTIFTPFGGNNNNTEHYTDKTYINHRLGTF